VAAAFEAGTVGNMHQGWGLRTGKMPRRARIRAGVTELEKPMTSCTPFLGVTFPLRRSRSSLGEMVNNQNSAVVRSKRANTGGWRREP